MGHWSAVWSPSFFSEVVHASSRDNHESNRTFHRTKERTNDSFSGNHSETNTPKPVVLLGGVPSSELLERIRTNDRGALEILYRSLFDALWNIAIIRTGEVAVAEEVLQDVFLRLWMRRDRLDVNLDIRVYLAAAVRNQTRDLGKHLRVIDATVHAVNEERQDIPGIGESPLTPDLQFETQEFLDAYHQAVTTLTDQEKIAVHLRWEQGMTFEELGEVLSLSKVGARKVVLRAQRKVQVLLEQYRD